MYVVSFYSYKGGVGRTVALLNSAWQLALRGARVALLDLDLEAPGLQDAPLSARGDGWGASNPTRGFCELVRDFQQDRLGRWQDVPGKLDTYITPNLGPAGRIGLIAAKGPNEHEYATFLHTFSWAEFYGDEKRPGKVVTASIVAGLADRGWDYLFIDARTGLTDVRGATLVDMPDLVVLLTNLSQQSVDGVSEQLRTIDSVNLQIEKFGESRSRRPGRYKTKIKTLLVASPLPVGELQERRSRIAAIERALPPEHRIRVEIDYLPLLALDETRQLLAHSSAQDPVVAVAMRPYIDLANAIVAANPRAAENVLEQGDNLLAAGRWREALAHYDDVTDRGESGHFWLRALTGKTRAQLRATAQVDRAQEGVRLLWNRATEPADKRQAVELSLALAWALVVQEDFEAAALEADHAYIAAESMSVELQMTCGFVAGQAWSWAGNWERANARLRQTELLCRLHASRPLLHALTLCELARLCAAIGPISDGHDAIRKARALERDRLVASNYLRARVQLAEAELTAEAGDGIRAISEFAAARDGFEREVEYAGTLEALAAIAEMAIDRYPQLDAHRATAKSLSMNVLDTRLQLSDASRALALGDWAEADRAMGRVIDPVSGASRPRETTATAAVLEPPQSIARSWHLTLCKIALFRGKLEDARAELDLAQQKHSALVHELQLMEALVSLASGAMSTAPDELEVCAEQLERKGLLVRALQARIVQGLFPQSRTHAAEKIMAMLPHLPNVDGWLWNLPIGFIDQTNATLLHFRLLLQALGGRLPWPRPQLPR